MHDNIYVDNKLKLEAVCRKLQHLEWLAVDTEFIREKTYFPRLALVQVASAEQVYCVDPLAIPDLSPLLDLMDCRTITKVFHAAGQDLETLYHQRGSVPSPVFDTQIAAAFLGFGEQLGYAQIVKKMLDVDLDKSSSRTDWMKRPLSSAQLKYAADDVKYLSRVYPIMVNRLSSLGRLSWMSNEVGALEETSRYVVDPSVCWTRVKGVGKLNRKQLNILSHLAMWREQRAMEVDRPRRWIVGDDAMVGLAIVQPATMSELQDVRLLSQKIKDRYGERLLSLIRTALDSPRSSWPEPKINHRPTVDEEATMDLLMAAVRVRAESIRLSPGQITSRGELLRLIRSETDLPVLSGWRRGIAGEALEDVLSGRAVLTCRDGKVVIQ